MYLNQKYESQPLEVAFHFDERAFDDPVPLHCAFLAACADARAPAITSMVAGGPVLLERASHVPGGGFGEQTVFSKERFLQLVAAWVNPPTDLFRSFAAPAAVPDLLAIVAMHLTSITRDDALALHAVLLDRTPKTYLGAMEVRRDNSIHSAIYLPIPRFRIETSHLRVLWDGFSEESKGPYGNHEDRQAIEALGFETVDFHAEPAWCY